MERNPTIQRIEETLERDIFDAKQNQPFSVSLMLRRGEMST